MKPTQLQVGDYVKYQGQIYIIEEISAKSWVHLIHPETRVKVNMTSDYITDLLEPIPLTPEILEKNGFDGREFSTLLLNNDSHLDYFYHEGRLRKWETIDVKIFHRKDYAITFQCKYCYYVHELQHALRLCGLNELADNFRMEE